jgi:hypothetical protein
VGASKLAPTVVLQCRNALPLDIRPAQRPKALHPGASRINGCFNPQKQLPIAPYALISEQSAKVSAL